MFIATKQNTIPSLAIVLAIHSITAIGADGDVKGIPVGPFEFRPLLDASESYSDNIYWNNRNRKGSLITQIQPGFQLAIERELNRFAVNYIFNSWQFHSSPNDNFVDHFVSGQAHIEFTSRNRLDVNARFMYAHNQRGTVFNQGKEATTSILSPDEFIQNDLTTRYRYGAEGARGNLELLFNLRDLTYQNHRNARAQWDRTEFVITPGFYFRAFPKTYFSTQAEVTVQSYKNRLKDPVIGVPDTVRTLDYDKERYLLGVTWDPTVKTSARLRLGYLQQNFSDRSLQSINDFTWDAGLQWMPKPYSRVSFDASRDVFPTFGYGYARLYDNFQLNWTHDWTDRISSRIGGSYQHANNEGSTRKDDYYGGRLDLGYKMRPWLGLGLSYTHLSQDSTFQNFKYDQNVVMFYISGNPLSAQSSGSPWHLWYGN